MPAQVYRPVGCLECRMTGYQGRIGIYELLPLSLELKRLITARADLATLRTQAVKDGLKPLRLAGARKVNEGVTTIQEVMKAAPMLEH